MFSVPRNALVELSPSKTESNASAFTPGIGMCATKRKMMSIAKTNAIFARTSGWDHESITAWSRRGRDGG